jgi:hypothetical protein
VPAEIEDEIGTVAVKAIGSAYFHKSFIVHAYNRENEQQLSVLLELGKYLKAGIAECRQRFFCGAIGIIVEKPALLDLQSRAELIPDEENKEVVFNKLFDEPHHCNNITARPELNEASRLHPVK